MGLCRRGSEFKAKQRGDQEAARLVEEGQDIQNELDEASNYCDVLADEKCTEECPEYDDCFPSEGVDEPDDGNMRSFDTGATRDTAEGKLCFDKFLSVDVLFQYAKYMSMNRLQSNGDLRDGDNWQKGIPMDAYMESGMRHLLEWWKIHRRNRPDKEENVMMRPQVIEMVSAICGVMFNSMGYLHELLKINDMVDFDGDEPTDEMKERRDETQKLSETESS
jgi:hypothetical protein